MAGPRGSAALCPAEDTEMLRSRPGFLLARRLLPVGVSSPSAGRWRQQDRSSVGAPTVRRIWHSPLRSLMLESRLPGRAYDPDHKKTPNDKICRGRLPVGYQGLFGVRKPYRPPKCPQHSTFEPDPLGWHIIRPVGAATQIIERHLSARKGWKAGR